MRELHFAVMRFLETCLTGEDVKKLLAVYNDEDRLDVDVPQMYDAALELYGAFEPWFAERAKEMGVADPGNRSAGREAEPGCPPYDRDAAPLTRAVGRG